MKTTVTRITIKFDDGFAFTIEDGAITIDGIFTEENACRIAAAILDLRTKEAKRSFGPLVHCCPDHGFFTSHSDHHPFLVPDQSGVVLACSKCQKPELAENREDEGKDPPESDDADAPPESDLCANCNTSFAERDHQLQGKFFCSEECLREFADEGDDRDF